MEIVNSQLLKKNHRGEGKFTTPPRTPCLKPVYNSKNTASLILHFFKSLVLGLSNEKKNKMFYRPDFF